MLCPGPLSLIKPPKKKQKVIDVEEPKTDIILCFPAGASVVFNPKSLLDKVGCLAQIEELQQKVVGLISTDVVFRRAHKEKVETIARDVVEKTKAELMMEFKEG
ncbi:hypothetical protein ACOSP7_009427 [Xanthoceras sorbifolium]